MEITKKDLLNGLTSKMNPVTEAADNNLSKVGDIKLYKLDQKTIGILTDRIKDEYIAHYYYRAAANWCQDKNYKKAAEFFTAEAINELTHAQGIQEYMTGFNIIPEIPQAPAVS